MCVASQSVSQCGCARGCGGELRTFSSRVRQSTRVCICVRVCALVRTCYSYYYFFFIVKYGRYYCGAFNVALCVLKWSSSMCGEIDDCGDDDASS